MMSRQERSTRGTFASLLLLLLAASQVVPAQPAPGSPPATVSLEQAVQMALSNNPALRAQRLNIDQARAGEVTAALKPNPVFTALNEDFPIFSPKDFTFDNLRTNQEYTYSTTYTIERGGKRQKRTQVARDTTDVTALTVNDAERQVRFQVAQAFIGVLLAKSNLELAQQDLKDYSDVVEINRRRYQAGDISNGDFLKIALQKLQFEQDVAAAELALAQSKISLRQLLGYQTVPENYDVGGVLEPKRRVILLDELEQQALLARPDLLAAQGGVKLAGDTVALAYGNRARDLTAESEFKRSGIINGVGFGMSIEIPIHNRNQGEIARSEFAVRQAQELQSAARIAVLSDVSNAYQVFRSSEANVALYESGYLDQARQSRDISRYAYQRGAASLLDLLDAERSYRATQLAYRQALAAHMTSLEQINFTVGRQVVP